MLNSTIRRNYFLFGSLMTVLLIGIAFLVVWQTGDAVLFFASNRTVGFNQFFKLTNLLGELPVFIAVGIILLSKGYKYVLGIPLVAVVVTVFTQVLKKIFAHPRPALFFEEKGLQQSIIPVEGEILNIGLNSFPSGHTAAAFALFVFTALVYSGNKKVAVIATLLAVLGGVSRIYLFQHFLKDVVFGAGIGIFAAFTCYLIIERWQVKWGQKTLLG